MRSTRIKNVLRWTFQKRGHEMKRPRMRNVIMKMSMLIGAAACVGGTAFAQTTKDIAGFYTIVAVTVVQGDKK